MIRPAAHSLADRPADTWHHVATQVSRGGFLVWDWTLASEDRRVLNAMRYPDYGERPAATTVIERRADGAVWLLAALMPPAAVNKRAREGRFFKAGAASGVSDVGQQRAEGVQAAPDADLATADSDWMTRAMVRANAGRVGA